MWSATDSSSSCPASTVREHNLRVAVRNLARALGDDVSEEQPLLDSRLPDGSRVAAALPPVSLGGTTLTIRKFQAQTFTAEQLVRLGTLTPEQLTVLRQAIEVRANILISGGTGTGKTTLLNALTAFLPAHDRLVLIEDTAELQLETPESGALRGPAGTGGLAGHHDSRLAAGDAAAPPRPHSRRRSARR